MIDEPIGGLAKASFQDFFGRFKGQIGRPLIRRCCAAVLGLIGTVAFLVSPALGGSLDLRLGDPVISAGFLTVGYNATTQVFSATGWPMAFDLNGTASSVDGGQYSLSATVSPNGQATGGSLDITGTIPGLATSGTLLTGELSQFGFQPRGGNIFEFVFNVTGGDLVPYYGGQTNVVLDANNSGFNGSFTSSFNASPFLSVADNGSAVTAVPEPSIATLMLGALGMGAPLLLCRLWRRNSAR